MDNQSANRRRAPHPKPKREAARLCHYRRQLAKKDLVRLDELRPTLADRIRADHAGLTERGADRPERGQSLPQSLCRRNITGGARRVHRARPAGRGKHRQPGHHRGKRRGRFSGAPDARPAAVRRACELRRSWIFLSSFGAFLLVWMAISVAMGDAKSFDPYPFILLNLVLSCLAAIQHRSS